MQVNLHSKYVYFVTFNTILQEEITNVTNDFLHIELIIEFYFLCLANIDFHLQMACRFRFPNQ